MTELHTAGPAPDAKSTAAPAGAAHSYPSTEDEEETSRPASQTSGSRYVPALAMLTLHEPVQCIHAQPQPARNFHQEHKGRSVDMPG